MVPSTGARRGAGAPGSAPRQALVLAGAAALVGCSPGPGGRTASTARCAPTEDGTLWAPSRRSARRPPRPARVGRRTPPPLSPGRHLAVAMIPRGGATEERPALYVISEGKDDEHAAILVSTDAPDARKAPRSATRPPADARPAPPRRAAGRREPPRARPPRRRVHRDAAPVQAPRRARRGRHAGARHQHDRRRRHLRHRLRARDRQGRRDVDERERRLRAGELQGVHDARGLLPGRARRRPERQDHAGQRRRGAQRQLPRVHHRGVRQADGDLAQVRARRTSCSAA